MGEGRKSRGTRVTGRFVCTASIISLHAYAPLLHSQSSALVLSSIGRGLPAPGW